MRAARETLAAEGVEAATYAEDEAGPRMRLIELGHLRRVLRHAPLHVRLELGTLVVKQMRINKQLGEKN